MGERIAYFGTVKLGTALLAIDPVHQRQGANIIAGISRTRAKLEVRAPNFLWTYRVWTQEVAAQPVDRSVAGNAKDLLDEMKSLEAISDDDVLRDLVWIDDDAKTTTVAASASAGSSVAVEVTSLTTLGAVADDYLLILGDGFSEVCLVESTDTGPPETVTVDELENDLSGGEVVLLVTIWYPSCRYDFQDPGQAQDRSGNRIRPRKTYLFASEAQPVWRT